MTILNGSQHTLERVFVKTRETKLGLPLTATWRNGTPTAIILFSYRSLLILIRPRCLKPSQDWETLVYSLTLSGNTASGHAALVLRDCPLERGFLKCRRKICFFSLYYCRIHQPWPAILTPLIPRFSSAMLGQVQLPVCPFILRCVRIISILPSETVLLLQRSYSVTTTDPIVSSSFDFWKPSYSFLSISFIVWYYICYCFFFFPFGCRSYCCYICMPFRCHQN